MILIKNGTLIDPASGTCGLFDVLTDGEKIVAIGACGSLDDMAAEEAFAYSGAADGKQNEVTEIDASGCIVAPGLVDCHVHFRDPGFTYKEDIESGAKAAAKGGFTTVVMMGNTNPHPDNTDTIKDMISRGEKTGIKVLCCGNVTKNMAGKELVDMKVLAGAGAVLFTDDGVPVLNEKLMEEACSKAKELGMVISLHEEDPQFISENGINAGDVAERLGIRGSHRNAEISMVDRDIKIAERTGAGIVIQHISTSGAVDMIREAKKRGVSVYAEATPHHFTLTEEAVLKYGALAKMNPPLRRESDRRAIIEGLKDGTIEMIATDHAPHSREEKGKELTKAPSGITGLETSLALGIRELVKPGYLTMPELLARMTCGPARVYGLDVGVIRQGGDADLVIFNPDEEWNFINSLSKSTNTPFLGERLPGRIHYTICRGRIVYMD